MNSYSLSDVGNMALTLAVAAIIVGLAASVLSNLQNDSTEGSLGYNATTSALTGISTFSSYINIIAIVAAAAIVIGILMYFFKKN